MALHPQLGLHDQWKQWGQILPANHHRQHGLQRHRDSTDPQYPHVRSDHRVYYHRWIRIQQSKSPTSHIPHYVHSHRHSLLLSAGGVPKRHRRLYRHDDR